MSDRRRDAEQLGRRAEWRVAVLYALRGYQIVERRFRASGGEIDLIARRGRVIAFIEVKRRDKADDAILAVTPANRRRIERASEHYLSHRPHFAEFAVRFDIAAVSRFGVRLVRDAWRSGE